MDEPCTSTKILPSLAPGQLSLKTNKLKLSGGGSKMVIVSE